MKQMKGQRARFEIVMGTERGLRTGTGPWMLHVVDRVRVGIDGQKPCEMCSTTAAPGMAMSRWAKLKHRPGCCMLLTRG